MSDDERLDLRRLEPVPPLAGWPERWSQTLLGHADACLRAAYLYVKYRGGTPSHYLDRGSLAHAVFERMARELVRSGESSYLSVAERELLARGANPVQVGAGGVAAVTAAIVEEVARAHPELHVPVGEKDDVRVMAYHWAVGMELDPGKVVAIERKFVLDVAGRELVGKVDLASVAGDVAQVDDYKTSWATVEQAQYERGFQGRMYALLLLFGHPVREVPCSVCGGAGALRHEGEAGQCPECGGRGVVEVRDAPIGERVQYVRTREVYPRFLLSDNTLRSVDNTLSRTDLHDFLVDLEHLVRRLDGARESGDFPARVGDHCSRCPARGECPLPVSLRSFAGEVNTMEQASEAAAFLELQGDRLAAVRKELRAFAKAHGPIRYGRDRELSFRTVEGRAVRQRGGRSDWDGLVEAAQAAAQYGQAFDIDSFVRRTASQRFEARTLSAAELAVERGHEEDQGGDRDWGDVPF